MATSGTCQYCGCHGDSCTLANGDKCAWADATRTVCNARGCLQVHRTRSAANLPSRSKYAGWGYGAIVEDLRKQRRAKTRRRRRAA